MDKEEALRELKPYLEQELSALGITNTRKNFRCLNPQHEDKNPSMSFIKDGYKCFCHSCNATYDVLDVIGLRYGYTSKDGLDNSKFNEVFEIACKDYGIPLKGIKNTSYIGNETTRRPQTPVNKNTSNKTQENNNKATETITAAQNRITDKEAIEYLSKRGISLETAKKYGLGYAPKLQTHAGEWQAIIYPTSETTYTARNINSDEKGKKVSKNGGANPFNLSAIYESQIVHIVEGETDTLSVIEAGGNAVGLCSLSGIDGFIDSLKEIVTSTNQKPTVKRFIVSLDNDEAGIRDNSKLVDRLEDIRLNLGLNYEVSAVNISGSYKDPNERWVNDPTGFKKALTLTVDPKEVEEYKQTSAANKLFDFIDGIADSVNTPPIPTGFNNLDRILDGGLYEGLYVIAAITSLGKTTYTLQLCDQIAQSGKDVLYVSLEMAANELIARSVSRLTFEIAAHQRIDRKYCKTVRGITDGKRHEQYNEIEKNLIQESYATYAQYADHIYIMEGLGDIGADQVEQAVKDHVRLTGQTPVIIIDYIQIMAPRDPRASDKQNMDWRVWDLKRLSRTYKTPVLVVSSLNRQNYDERINLAALKESGALEYSSDVVIGLQLEGAGSKESKQSKKWVDEQMSKDPREIEAVILKNRNGARGDSLYYDYYPMFNFINEKDRKDIATH